MQFGRALGIVAAGGMLAGCMFVDLGDDSGSADNHAPFTQPASVTLREDAWETFTIYAQDIDGDDLQVTMSSSFGGETDLKKITQTTVDGVNHLEADVEIWGFTNFYGEGDFKFWVSDGVERTPGAVHVIVTPDNDRPTARGDAFATAPDTELLISGATLLANDDDAADVLDDDEPANRGLTIASVGTATHGTVSYAAGNVRFVPDAGFAGSAPFTYTITDGEDTAEATVRVLVGGNNAVPIAVEDSDTTIEGTPVDIDIGRLVANDRDDDGHTLTVIGVGNPEHGTVELTGRTIRFSPMGEPGGTFFGTAGFEYTVTDGAATATGHVIVEVAPLI